MSMESIGSAGFHSGELTRHLLPGSTIDRMIKACGNAVMTFVILSLLDRYLFAGRYADAAEAIFRQFGHGFG